MAKKQWYGSLVGWLGILAALMGLVFLFWVLLTWVRFGSRLT